MGLGVEVGEQDGERSRADDEEGQATGEFGEALFDHV